MTMKAIRKAFPLLPLLTFGLVIAGSLSAVPVNAQQTPPAKTDNQASGAITSPTYQISVDDVFQVTIATLDGFGPTVADRVLNVLPDGTADLPYLGETKVIGLTLAEVKARLKKAVAKKLVRPDITVAVKARFQKTVNLFGMTASRGKIPLRDNWRIRDVIAAAGDLPTDRYDLIEASLLRNRTGEVIPIDLQKLLGDKDPAQNIAVEPDDSLFIREIDSSRTQVQVIGQVAKQGPVILPRSRSVVDVIQAAGGTTERASLSQVVIQREGKEIVVDLTNYRKTGIEPSEKLQFGDRLVVPENKREYYLFGNFGNSGTKIYPEDQQLTLTKVIALTGGQIQGADIKNTRLTRVGPDGKTKFTTVVNVEKMLKNGDFSNDPVIQPGDSIYIPPAGRRKGFTVQEIVGIVGGLGFLFTQLNRL